MFENIKSKQKQSTGSTVQKKDSEKVAMSPNLTGIPDAMKTQFESLSGFSFDDVRVHYNSDKPAQLQALAYTHGNQVHIAPGQEQHLRHELGHVVQQKQGRVLSTGSINGIPINDDSILEHEADSYLRTTSNIVKTRSVPVTLTQMKIYNKGDFKGNEGLYWKLFKNACLDIDGDIFEGKKIDGFKEKLLDSDEKENFFDKLNDEERSTRKPDVSKHELKRADMLFSMWLSTQDKDAKYSAIQDVEDEETRAAINYADRTISGKRYLWIEHFVSFESGAGEELLNFLAKKEFNKKQGRREIAYDGVALAAYGGSEAYYLRKGFEQLDGFLCTEKGSKIVSKDAYMSNRLKSGETIEEHFNDYKIYKIYIKTKDKFQ